MPGSPVTKTICGSPVTARFSQRREGAISAYQPARGRGHRQTRRGPVADWGDEAVPAPGEGFDEQRLLGVVPEGGSDLEDVALQDFRLDVSVGPQCIEEFSVRQ